MECSQSEEYTKQDNNMDKADEERDTNRPQDKTKTQVHGSVILKRLTKIKTDNTPGKEIIMRKLPANNICVAVRGTKQHEH